MMRRGFTSVREPKALVSRRKLIHVLVALALACLAGPSSRADVRSPSYASVISGIQPRMVKIFGAGGLRNLESYQSGFLISADGFILTAWSYVLDTGNATVILDDGRKFIADVTGIDPRTEVAILKIEASDLPHFELADAKRLIPGTRVLAFGNVYGVATGDEPTSVLHGIVSGITKLSARRGSFETPYRGDVYVLDAMTNNAGAAGGAITDSRGRLAGMLGKELRDAQTNIWLNYAVPIAELRDAVTAILAGKPTESVSDQPERRPEESADLAALGIVLLPNVLRITPAYVDTILPNTPAAKTDLRPDDLIVAVDGQTVSSQSALEKVLSEIDAVDPLRLTVIRENELLEFVIEPLITAAP